MDYHKERAGLIRLSDDLWAKFKDMVRYYEFNSMSDLVRNFINYSYGEFQPPENFEKTEKMLSDSQSQALKQIIENSINPQNLIPSRQTILTLVKMIHDDFGEGILYRMCETKKNDIMNYLSVAVEPWVDIIQGKFYSKTQIPVRKEDVRAGLRIWFKNATENGEFKKVLEEYLASKILKKLSDKQKKDES